jgi:hypothetical protein
MDGFTSVRNTRSDPNRQSLQGGVCDNGERLTVTNSSHGIVDLLWIACALTAAGVLAGRYFSGARLMRMIASPLYAIPTFLIAIIVFKVLGLIFGFDVIPGPSRFVSGPNVDQWFRPLFFSSSVASPVGDSLHPQWPTSAAPSLKPRPGV